MAMKESNILTDGLKGGNRNKFPDSSMEMKGMENGNTAQIRTKVGEGWDESLGSRSA